MHRRQFVAAAAAGLAALATPALLRAGHPHRRPRAAEHPEPRPGITAEKVLPDDQVPERHKRAYAVARERPELLDGIYCHCDCSERHETMRSLLSCFEAKMPQTCGICRGEAEMAGRLAAEGKTLAEIRTAIDERWG